MRPRTERALARRVSGPALALLAAGALTTLGSVMAAGADPAVVGDPADSEIANAAPTSRHGSVTLEPGYYPPADPESASVRIGRRLNAPPLKKPFTGGAKSLDDLGRKVCRALFYARADSMRALCVTKDEFRDILWREFPMSRPATGIQWEDGWVFLDGRLNAGSVSSEHDYGGKHYDFVRWERYDTTRAFRNFKLYKGLVLRARDDQGQEYRWTWLRAAVERKGRFKIYSMKD